MSTRDTYVRQISLLDGLSREIESLQRQIDRDREDYHGQIGALEANGFMGEYVTRLNDRYRLFSQLVDNMQQYLNGCRKNIEEGHKVVIHNRIRAIDEADRNSAG
jgi:plasmid maintenance system killer protein